jgi:hypothetical protein
LVLAFSAKFFVSSAIVDNPLAPALKTIGVINPVSVLTAIDISALLNFLM